MIAFCIFTELKLHFMASVKIVFWKHDQKKDGSFPISIRITKDRKTRYIFTGRYVYEKDWDFTNNKSEKIIS